MMGAVRLQRLIAGAGLASRREAERWIEAGRVSVNGAVASLGQSADPGHDDIRVDGRPLAPRGPLRYWILHKPRGVLSSRRDDRGRQVVTDLIPGEEYLYPVGRLDMDSTGLMLLTNDGDLAHALLHPSRHVPRRYLVEVSPILLDRALAELRAGIVIDGHPRPPIRLEDLGRGRFEIVLGEGRKRQIRRMFRAVGAKVRSLVRVAMGPLVLGMLPEGACRELLPEEIEALRLATGIGREPSSTGAPRRSGGRKRP